MLSAAALAACGPVHLVAKSDIPQPLVQKLPAGVALYVPTTPNPTGGYFVIVPRKNVIELEMSVDQALKYVISMGVVPPQPR